MEGDEVEEMKQINKSYLMEEYPLPQGRCSPYPAETVQCGPASLVLLATERGGVALC